MGIIPALVYKLIAAFAFLFGAVLAAHNVRFDHGFLKSEYRRLGTVLRHKVMCTVKLPAPSIRIMKRVNRSSSVVTNLN